MFRFIKDNFDAINFYLFFLISIATFAIGVNNLFSLDQQKSQNLLDMLDTIISGVIIFLKTIFVVLICKDNHGKFDSQTGPGLNILFSSFSVILYVIAFIIAFSIPHSDDIHSSLTFIISIFNMIYCFIMYIWNAIRYNQLMSSDTGFYLPCVLLCSTRCR